MDPDTKPQTVLIVDDTPLNIQVLARALSSICQIKIANSGAKALEIVANQDIDLILLDIMMPEMDGYEVCRRLKGHPKSIDVPIIFVTAKGEFEAEEKGLSLGAVDYISKPFYLPIVRARVETQLRLQRKTKLLEKLAAIDGLTEIPNRRSFDEAFIREWGRSKRQGESIAVMMFDVDYFKKYNDSQGHAAGDRCLKTIAYTLGNCIKRSTDFLARYGGEEFVVLLSDTDAVGAKRVADIMRNAVESVRLPHPESKVSPFVTVSVGIASVIPDEHLTAKEVLRAADQMLYQAKRDGRNQIATIAM